MTERTFPQCSHGFGVVEIMIVMAFMSIVVLGVATLNNHLSKQNAQIGSLETLDAFMRGIPSIISDNPSWLRTANSPDNPEMACLLNGQGASCNVNRRFLFNLYESTGRPVYISKSPQNGITAAGLLCGPIATAANRPPNTVSLAENADFSANNASVRCPMRYAFEWAALDNNPYPVVAIIVSLIMGKRPSGAPVIDLLLNRANYSYADPMYFDVTNSPTFPQFNKTDLLPDFRVYPYTQPPPHGTNGTWPPSFIFRSAI